MSYQPTATQSILDQLDSGHRKISWAKNHMPIINQLLNEYSSTQPLAGYTVVTSVHLEAKTAYLVQVLAALGANVFATGCNPLSTQDDVALALAETPNVSVYAKYNCNEKTYWDYLHLALSHKPHVVIDDGGDLVELLLTNAGYRQRLLGGCEETTTGIHRLKILAESGKLLFPMIDVNDADCKHNYDNHYGTGQSVTDGILRTTNLIIAGKTVVIAGYGDCGSGIAKRMHGLGAKVIITEVDPIKALKANMDGYTVMTMDKAAKIGDVFITATGCEDVIRCRHFRDMKNGAIMANAGHFNVEINLPELEHLATKISTARKNIEAYKLDSGKTLYLIADGRLVNLAAADGHAAEIMDMSFSIQLLSVIHIAHNFGVKRDAPSQLLPVPQYIDEKVAKIALETQHITIDKLTLAQRKYLGKNF